MASMLIEVPKMIHNKATAAAVISRLRIIIIIMYLYSAQYLHILQDPKRYLTNPIVQVQPQLTSNSHSPNWKIEAQG